jgi:adenylate cyclase
LDRDDLKQRLLAILAADAAGYSRLMSADERATVAALEAARAVFKLRIEAHSGRVVDTAGDSVLAVFETAAGAVHASLAVQQELVAANADLPDDRRMQFRIGLHLGDVFEKTDGTVYGDGVNIAARLQALADPGGITISDAVRAAVRGKVVAAFQDQGEQTVKNIAEPVRAFALRADEPNPKTSPLQPQLAAVAINLSLPDKPSVAVLPFTNMSGGVEQDYFCDGVTEDIITELSRFDSLFVIARNSTFSYKGKSPDVRQVGKELGVRYVLEGSIRRSDQRIRVTAQLIDAVTGNHIWAERYDRLLEDIFAVQDELTSCIVGAIAPQVDTTEIVRARRRPLSISAYELALRASALVWDGFQKSDLAARNEAIALAHAALAADPESVAAWAVIAFAQWQHVVFRTADDIETAWQTGMNAAAQGIAISQSNLCHSVKAALLAYCPMGSRWEEARIEAERAWRLNPQDSRVLSNAGFIIACTGEPDEGIRLMERALRINPRDPFAFNHYENLAQAHLAGRRYEEGLQWAKRATHMAPWFAPGHTISAALYVGLAEIENAKASMRIVQQLAPKAVRATTRPKADGTPADAGPGATARLRYQTFIRIASGLADPRLADGLR